MERAVRGSLLANEQIQSESASSQIVLYYWPRRAPMPIELAQGFGSIPKP